MTMEERLERLTERHEALTQSVEMLVASTKESLESSKASGAALDRRIAALTAASEADAENIRALARIAEIHEHRITGLEGGAQNK